LNYQNVVILIVQHYYFSNLCPAKILNFSIEPFFPCARAYTTDRQYTHCIFYKLS